MSFNVTRSPSRACCGSLSGKGPLTLLDRRPPTQVCPSNRILTRRGPRHRRASAAGRDRTPLARSHRNNGLAVDQAGPHPQGRGQREPFGEVIAVAGVKGHYVAVALGENAEAVVSPQTVRDCGRVPRHRRPCRTIAALHSENAAGVRVHGSIRRASSIANRCLLKYVQIGGDGPSRSPLDSS
jgi:hypothetical protein